MDVVLHARSTREYLQKLADKACRRWKVPLVRVKFSEHTYWYGECFYEGKCIKLYAAAPEKRKRPGSGRNPVVLLHEAAHWIDDQLRVKAGQPFREEAHNPVFAAICADLFDYYGVIPYQGYKALCREYGVKLAILPRPHRSHGHKRKRLKKSSS